MAKYDVSILTEKDHPAYHDFLQHHPDSLYEHSLEIKEMVEKYFGFTPLYLIATKQDSAPGTSVKNYTGNSIQQPNSICGILPLFKAISLVEGTRFVSIPFFPFGGVLGENVECEKTLLDKAKELSHGGKFLEIRQQKKLKNAVAEGLVMQSPIIDFYLDFKENEEKMMQSLDKSVRYDIRKAQKFGLKVYIGKEKKGLDDFYDVYLNTRKRRGVPAWPYGLFEEALLKCKAKVSVTYLEGKPIAAAFLFFDKEVIEYAFAGADYKYTHMCPYYLLIWEVIRSGIKDGYKRLDFGGTTREMNDGNMYLFKDKWCSGKEEIPYYFYSKDPKNIPALKSSFKIYKIYGTVWSLLPKKVIKLISPYVIRQFV